MLDNSRCFLEVLLFREGLIEDTIFPFPHTNTAQQVGGADAVIAIYKIVCSQKAVVAKEKIKNIITADKALVEQLPVLPPNG